MCNSNKYAGTFAVCLFTLFVVYFLDAFQTSIWGDRAYVMYMNQLVYKGLPLYTHSTFGYTPLGPLVASAALHLCDAIGMAAYSSMTKLKICALALYIITSGSMYLLAFKLFRSVISAWSAAAFFICVPVIYNLSSTNFEPKVLGVLFEIWALRFFMDRKYVLAGVAAACSMMCWQLYIGVGLGLFLTLLFIEKREYALIRSMGFFGIGFLMGAVPVILYLWTFDLWDSFIELTIIRKYYNEGAVLVDAPLQWLKVLNLELSMRYIQIPLLLSAGALLIFKRRQLSFWKCERRATAALLITFMVWVLINTMEFQGSPDLIPIVPFLALFMSMVIHYIHHVLQQRGIAILIIAACIVPGLWFNHDYGNTMDYREQRDWIHSLYQKYGDAIVFSFEEYYVLRDQLMPNRYVRNAPYEEYVLSKYEECPELMDQYTEHDFNYYIIRKSVTGALVPKIQCLSSFVNDHFSHEPIMRIHHSEINSKFDYEVYQRK